MPQNKADFHPQKLQQALAQSILNPDAPYVRDLDNYVIENDISLAGRLDVYKNNVVGGLIDVLLARYPTLEKIVGDEFAHQMARTYILANYPRSGNLNEYGGDYADFINGFEPASGLPFLADIARLENLEHLAYYAPDGQEITLENAAEILPKIMDGKVDMCLHPSVGLLESAYPVLKLKRYTQIPNDQQGEFDLDQGGEQIMVWRFGFRIEAIELDKAPYALLSSLKAHGDLNAALEAAIACDAGFSFNKFWQETLPREIFCYK